MKKKKPSLLRSIGTALAVLIVLVIYAYGFQVTKVNLEETKSERRQEQLFRILRALAKPNLFEYEKEEFLVSTKVYVPCPEGGYESELPEDRSQPYLVVTPGCSNVRTDVHVEGFNFEPFTKGPLNFEPYGSGVKLQLATVEPDKDGHFEVVVRLPNRPDENAHDIVAVTRRNVGSPTLTKAAYDTWDKIIETVFLALLATTLGVILSIPMSFFAARNLMKDVTSSLQAMSLSILLVPIGFYLGLKVAGWSEHVSLLITDNVLFNVLGILIAPMVIFFGIRWALPQQEIRQPSTGKRVTRMSVLLVVAFVAVITLYLVSYLMLAWGESLGDALGNLGFLGRFIHDLGDILDMITNALVGLAVAGVFGSVAGRWGEALSRQRNVPSRITHSLSAIAAGAFLAILLAATVNWFYQFRDLYTFYARSGIIGAVLGFLASLRYKTIDPVPTGMIIYYVSRTIWNALRSIEALVMAIVFVVWVGIGPFAGSLALALHTIAALTKLYSEQVESIMAGPIEAIQATGATRLQTIVYAVLPQIIPPYISFTMYRWDINVRMSTIIGFAGGGGIGFLLQQNINLLNYRDASAQMLAIAVVVAAMDFISSKLRENVV